jgi:acyl dehydratase
MALTAKMVGLQSPVRRRAWDERDAIIYALGIGAGTKDPTEFELEYTTENSQGRPQRVLPTFATVIGASALELSAVGEIEVSQVVHGDEVVTVHSVLPTSGSVDVVTTVSGIYDKGSGALISLDSTVTDCSTKRLLATTSIGAFVRGAGGFGGPRSPEPDDASSLASEPFPNRAADHSIRYVTRSDQALLYRMSGDRNPLHSDPVFARRAKFDRPILHGLCTFGFSGRALLHSVCESDSELFGSMRARFSQPTMPGDTLTTSIWDVTDSRPGAFRFRTQNQNGDIVIDNGLLIRASLKQDSSRALRP